MIKTNVNRIEVEIKEIYDEINEKVYNYRMLYEVDPTIIVVPDYIEYVMKNYIMINIEENKKYTTYMGILIVGTKRKKNINEIEVF